MEFINFLNNSPTCYQTVEQIKKQLNEDGFTECIESSLWNLEKGKKYYVIRNQSSIIAFKIGEELNNMSYAITASHCDAPTFKVKPKYTIKKDGYVCLNTEPYGGAIWNTWMDHLLSLAGRVIVKEDGKLVGKPLKINEPIGIIPNLAIHLNRTINDGVKLNAQVDMLPMISLNADSDLFDVVAKNLGVEKESIIDTDLYLYPTEQAVIWGSENEFVTSYHLDNLQCTYATLKGFLAGKHKNAVTVFCSFDNEEVGSNTRQGADSTFLKDVLERISISLNQSKEEFKVALANSIMISADNAHALHPNHPEKSDPTNLVKMNQGIVIKYNANQNYTTDAISASLFKELCSRVDVNVQEYTNRSDERGGSTLGAVNTSQVSITSVDIGCAQLAMHSVRETAGTKDTDMMIKAITEFYNLHITMQENGVYQIEK